MPGIKVHLLLGSLIYPVFYISYFLLSKIDPITKFGVNATILSYLLFVLGSDLPDIDADFAPIRYFTHAIIPAFFIYYFYKSDFIRDFFENFGVLYSPLLVTTAVLFGLLTGYFLKLLKHRGFLHTIRFAVLYGTAIFLSVMFGMGLKKDIALFLSLSGTFGVVVHLVLDKEIKF